MSPATEKSSQLNPAVARVIEDSQAAVPEPLRRRERNVEACLAIAVFAAAIGIGAGFHAERVFAPGAAALFLAAYLLAKRIKFTVRASYTVPAQLVFVPMLLLLPTPLVPLLVIVTSTLVVVPEHIAQGKHWNRLLLGPGDAAYTIPPTLVLLLGHAQTPEWSHWPVYLAALAAQFVFDPALNFGREWLALGVSPRLEPEMSAWVLLVDALLSPIGFMAALVGAQEAGGWLLVVPLLGLIAVFARERQARIEHALELGRAYRGTTLLLSDVLEADDEYTGNHSWGVVTLAMRVADAVGLDAHQRRNVEFGALLHDIGKIAVPKEIINKPGPLDAAEWLVIKTHTVEGERLLKRVGGVLGEVGQIVRSSHERWDGAGYPDGLKGDEIPIEACIVACCDAFDAMTTDRSYRKAMPLARALEEIRANAGTQFSPRVAHVMVELLRHEAQTASAGAGARVQLPSLGADPTPAPGTP
jgi:putative nucleotidyltransferase with HDIG domain